ncbi:fibrous sheath CABYR-binding protein-like isoform X42 [Eriocheir sinensis]|uniref:fibrous sheath CABYR-binding protein-like isoform X42 n=1 Tax=Eriocheir sinensis TaxID=95602 RepID=UPI0021C69195|nr:fibrous sheath CABYR-binding protein-like isoform X42 [Eriocheir sinensis]
MAGAGKGRSTGNNPEDCPVCLTNFDIMQRPHNLPCGHTVCMLCIDKLKEQGRVSCPECRVSHAIPEGGQFPVSFIAEAFIRKMRGAKVAATAASLLPSAKKRKRTAEPADSKEATGFSKKMRFFLQEQEDTVVAAITACRETQSQLDQYQTTLTGWGKWQQQLEDRLQGLVDQSRSAIGLVQQEESRTTTMEVQVKEVEQALQATQEKLHTLKTEEEVGVVVIEVIRCTGEAEQVVQECQECFPDANTVTTIRKVIVASSAALDTSQAVQAALETPTVTTEEPRPQSDPTEPRPQSDPAEPRSQSDPAEPRPQSDPAEPRPQSDPAEPSPQSDPAKPRSQSDPAKPRPQSDPAKPRPQSDPAEPRPQSDPAKPRPQSDPAKPRPQSDPAKPRPQSDPAKPRPQSDPAKPRPQSDPAKSRPQSDPAKPRPQSDPAEPRAQSDPAKPRPQSDPAKTRPQSDPAKPRPQSDPAKPRPQSDPAKPRSQSDPAKPRPQSDPAEPRPQSDPAEPRPQSDPAEPRPQSDPAKPRPQSDPAEPRAQSDPAEPRPQSDPDSTIMDRVKLILTLNLKTKDLRSLSQPPLSLIQAGQVFAVCQVEGQRRLARISFEASRLCLHALKEQHHSLDAATLQVSMVVPPSPPCMVFLDLSWPGSSPRRVQIHLSPDTPWGRQFMMMCTGQHGPSYLNTRLFSVGCKGKPGEYVVGGHHKSNDDTLNEGAYSKSGRAGAVRGMAWKDGTQGVCGLFAICTRECRNDIKLPRVFGEVVNGLHVVAEAAQHIKIGEVTVVDCGVVL